MHDGGDSWSDQRGMSSAVTDEWLDGIPHVNDMGNVSYMNASVDSTHLSRSESSTTISSSLRDDIDVVSDWSHSEVPGDWNPVYEPNTTRAADRYDTDASSPFRTPAVVASAGYDNNNASSARLGPSDQPPPHALGEPLAGPRLHYSSSAAKSIAPGRHDRPRTATSEPEPTQVDIIGPSEQQPSPGVATLEAIDPSTGAIAKLLDLPFQALAGTDRLIKRIGDTAEYRLKRVPPSLLVALCADSQHEFHTQAHDPTAFAANQAFGTDFLSTFGQATIGVDWALCQAHADNDLLYSIFDIEGAGTMASYRVEAGQPLTFAVASILFAYRAAHCILLHVLTNNAFNFQAAGLEMLSRLFEFIVKSEARASNLRYERPKRKLVFVLRDYVPGFCPKRDEFRVQMKENIEMVWGESITRARLDVEVEDENEARDQQRFLTSINSEYIHLENRARAFAESLEPEWREEVECMPLPYTTEELEDRLRRVTVLRKIVAEVKFQRFRSEQRDFRIIVAIDIVSVEEQRSENGNTSGGLCRTLEDLVKEYKAGWIRNLNAQLGSDAKVHEESGFDLEEGAVRSAFKAIIDRRLDKHRSDLMALNNDLKQAIAADTSHFQHTRGNTDRLREIVQRNREEYNVVDRKHRNLWGCLHNTKRQMPDDSWAEAKKEWTQAFSQYQTRYVDEAKRRHEASRSENTIEPVIQGCQQGLRTGVTWGGGGGAALGAVAGVLGAVGAVAATGGEFSSCDSR
ncbi:hypothetical protein IAU60_006927 [Kwoniella sp. DSM 27419]